MVIERRGSMTNQTSVHFWTAALSILNPGHMIDVFLDRIETLSGALVPAQADLLLCKQTRSDAHLDQLSAPPFGDHARY
jgi:hypothetical protein